MLEGDFREDEVLEQAQEMIKTDPQSPWGWFVTVAVCETENNNRQKALDAGEKAMALMPDHPDIIWMRGKSLLLNRQYDEVISWVDKYKQKIEQPAELLVLQARTLKAQAKSKDNNPEKWNQSIKVFEEALVLDPASVNACIQTNRVKYVKDTSIYKKALRIYPYSS